MSILTDTDGPFMRYEACIRAARQLSQQLAEGKRLSSMCPKCLVDFAYDHSSVHWPLLREDCPELFDGCVLMLMTPRTPDELACLQRRPGHCSQHRRVRADLPIKELIGPIFEALELIVLQGLHLGDNAPAVRARNTQKAFANSSGRWPSRLDQLVPFGAAQAVSWLLDLAEQRICGAPLAMLGNCVIMARGVVLPVILADINRSRLVSILCSTLRMAAYECPSRQDPRAVATVYINRLRAGPGFLPRDFDRLVAGCEVELYEATCGAIESAPDSPKRLAGLVPCCARLHDLLGARATRRPPACVLQHLSERALATPRAPLPLGLRLALARTLIQQAAGAARCAAPGCGLAVLQLGDRAKFRVCARCRVPRYCSRECQAHAWRDGGLPHRTVCAVLCKFAAHTDADRDQPVGAVNSSFARTVAELTEGEVEVFNAWLTACREEFGTAPELLKGPVDVRDPLRFLWKFLRYMSWAGSAWLCLAVCGYCSLSLCPVLMAFLCILFLHLAD